MTADFPKARIARGKGPSQSSGVRALPRPTFLPLNGARLPARAGLLVVVLFGWSSLASRAAAEEPVASASGPSGEPAPETHLPVTSASLGPREGASLSPPLDWKWSRFSGADYVITSAGGAITLTAAIFHPRARHSLSGGILFDDAARKALRAKSYEARYEFRDASDVGLSLAVTWPFFADALVTAWWYRGSRDVAQEMALIDLETMAISSAVQGVTNTLISRERPYGRDCGTDSLPNASLDCSTPQRYRSYFSGHSSFSFTSAALICMHHFENELLGAPWDSLSCAGGYAVAATTATFRVVGDVHYASDVISGAVMGTLIGYGVPWLHYRHKNLTALNTGGVQLQFIPSGNGLSVLGIF